MKAFIMNFFRLGIQIKEIIQWLTLTNLNDV